MPLRPGLLALLLLAPAWAPAQPAPTVPTIAYAVAAPANLLRRPELASDYDRGLLLDAGYQIERDGAVLDKQRKPLDELSLKSVLEELRAKRMESVLKGLEAVQEDFARNGGLAPDQRARMQTLLESGWPLIPEEVRAGFNQMLASAGSRPVPGPKLDWVERAAKSWDKEGPEDSREARPRDISLLGDPPLSKRISPPYAGKPGRFGEYHDEFSPPPPDVVKARVAEVDTATWRDPKTGELKPYTNDVKETLREVAKYADERDGEAALRVLRKIRPVIEIKNSAVPPFAGGVAHAPDPEDADDFVRIGINEYGVMYPTGKKEEYGSLPSDDPGYYRKMGLPVPSMAAMDPSSKPEEVKELPYAVVEHFEDGSIRYRPNSRAKAQVLLHELLHLDTHDAGAGVNAFSNEMRSFTAENRLAYNQHESLGMTKSEDYGKDWDWYARPLDFRRGIITTYTDKSIGEILEREETVEGQIEKGRSLRANGDLAAWKTKRVNESVDRHRDNDLSAVDALEKGGLIGKVEAEQARERVAAAAELERKKRLAKPANAKAEFEDEMSRLEKDRELTLKVFLEDWRWHEQRGIGAYTKGKNEKP